MLELPPGTLEAFGLVAIRTSALVLSSSALGQGTGFAGMRIGLIAVLSLVLYAVVGEPLAGEVGVVEFGAMAVRELLIGLFLSFVLQLVLLAVITAGEMIGHEMGFMMARQVDPDSGFQVQLVSRIYETFFLLAFFAVDGHHWLIGALRGSFERAPIGRMTLSPNVTTVVIDLFGEMFSAGLAFAAPVMILLVLVSILIGLLARAVPTLNILEIGFSIRILLGIGAMFLFAPLLEPSMLRLQESVTIWLDRALDAMET